jgi:stage IV sporulation protein B
MTRRLGLFIAVIIAVFSVYYFIVSPIYAAAVLPKEIYLTKDEYAADRPINIDSRLSLEQTQELTVGEETSKYITIKLFGFIPIKKMLVNILPFDTVLIGGNPIGIKGDIDGVLVTADYGKEIKTGDIITAVNGNAIYTKNDFDKAINNKSAITITVLRNGDEKTKGIKNPIELAVRDTTQGVGILTLINPENNNFSALGHQMGDFDTGASVNLRGGEIKEVNSFGIDKTVGRKTGVIRSSLKNSAVQGSITRGTKFGIYGCLTKESTLLKNAGPTMPIATRYNVHPGKATLRTCLDGVTIEEFNCEIIKTRFQEQKDDKSMIIRITDRRLLDKTGGIIHGMSGSPIIQDNHLIGALTHATTYDPSKGYAIYIDFIAV